MYLLKKNIYICLLKNIIFSYRSKLEELMTVQKLRERPKGVNIVGLALGDAVSSIDVIVDVRIVNIYIYQNEMMITYCYF